MSEVKIKNKFGTLIGWNNIKVNLHDRDVEGITEIEYTDEREMNNEYGQGKYAIGQSEGNHSAKAAISLYVEEIIGLQKSLKSGQCLQDIAAFDISVVYEYNDKVIKDVVRNCRFKNNGRSLKQNDGKIITKIELLTSHIDYNV